MKIILTIIVLSAALAIALMYQSNQDEKQKTRQVTLSALAEAEQISHALKPRKKVVSTIGGIVKPVTIEQLDTRVSSKAMDIALLLQAPTNDQLIDTWRYAYGCGNLEENDIDACEFKTMFNAESLEEALWMKRHGFPHREMLEQLKDQNNHDAIVELAQNGYKPAIALAALVTDGFGLDADATRWAAQFAALSDPSEIYAHRLVADIESSQDPLSFYALQQYLIAQHLGDYEAGILAEQYWTGSDHHNNSALDSALEYILNHIGPPFDQEPLDPRPRVNGGG